ncbi:Leucyl aminopeptidase (aminopeptidase T) [Maridesulfovibrio ferrireducens]|uniref:Leucyl aminopeptidase (Aminopeptidase T) n=1 Tax=Maridesulfovibrio ferrireducens TaxID=246191 RepID=A0A1G9ECC1_9BACT|nr:aminopeptidase [Maridesulfovibrio ferrireducens]SDK73799.1 Leucyl aminopeptidase (aminopeptidase T) [Maridesulfovibrio ferrireducens]
MTKLFPYEDLREYAKVLIGALELQLKSPFKNRDIIIIKYDNPATPLAEALFALLIEKHLHPVMETALTPAMKAELYINSSYGQLTFFPPGKTELYDTARGVIRIHAPEEVGAMAEIDPLSIMANKKASNEFRQRLEKRKIYGSLAWTECVYPTQALADKAGFSLEEYTTKLMRACYLNMPSPAQEWKKISEKTSEIALWLSSMDIKTIRIQSELCDLYFSPGANRQWQGSNGGNIPSYEVYISPDCRTVNGYYFADLPSLYMDRMVYGVHLEFSDGIAVRATAMGGEKFLLDQLRADGGARRVGEFSLTDSSFSRVDHFMSQTILDENFGGEFGSCHIALGQSLLETFSGPPEMLDKPFMDALGFNTSNTHWDLVNTEEKIIVANLADGKRKVIYENGVFKI